MGTDRIELLKDVASYYTGKLQQFGETPQGVDWNGEESQIMRFMQLCKIITKAEHFSLNDLGCGYGALLSYLTERHKTFSYLGIDISEKMIRSASQRYHDCKMARFISAMKPDSNADFGLASGIFNVRLKHSESEWIEYIEKTIDVLNRTSILGFAFNCLTSYSDKDKMRDYLFYADPCYFFDLCKRRYSRQVALLHDYGLYEFTILVRKQ